MNVSGPVAERSELNGTPVSIEDLRVPALSNYGHFTSMQVRDGGVRGLDLHLARLDAATRELFGHPLDMDAVLMHLRHIVDGERAPLSLRINVFSRRLHRDRMAEPAAPDVLITIGPGREAETEPLRLKSFRHQRTLPHIKHVGTFELFHHRRLAQLDGYDDALFVDASGLVSEGSIWNIGFFDGTHIVWPDAPMLTGISMQLLERGLRARGVATITRRIALDEVGAFRAAFFTNSGCTARAVASIDSVAFAHDLELIALLDACYASNPPQPI